MAGITTLTMESLAPSWPDWLKRPQAALSALVVIAAVAVSFVAAPRLGDVIAESAVVEIETSTAPELSREWRWQREPVSFESMYGSHHRTPRP